jgi:DNA-binding beta-propeller fold protein YncE
VGDHSSRVLVFDASVSTLTTAPLGENAEYVFGQTDFTSGGDNYSNPLKMISGQSSLAYDSSSGRLFVADSAYNRVMVFDASPATLTTLEASSSYGEDAEYVFGQPDFTTFVDSSILNQSNLNNPKSLTYDSSSGRLFVGDGNNSRVMVFDASPSTLSTLEASFSYGENAEYVFGQSSFTAFDYPRSMSMNVGSPSGLAYDSSSGHLFVADSDDNRILVFDASPTTLATASFGEDADNVLGQANADGTPSFTRVNMNGGITASGLNFPSDVAVDLINHRLFVADTHNNRVLVFTLDSTDNIASREATYVFGQTDFTSNVSAYNGNPTATTRNGLSGPFGLIYDSSSERLFVADTNNSRVVVFDASPTTLASAPLGKDAEYVFGQTDFTSNISASANHGNTTTRNGLSGPVSLAYDSSSGRLFVADSGGNNSSANNRVLVFDASPTTLSTLEASFSYGENAEYVFGQTDFASTGINSNPLKSITIPSGLAYDSSSGHLFVADSGDNRILVFDASPTTLSTLEASASYGEDAEYVFGQPDFTTLNYNATSMSSVGGGSPSGLSYDSSSGHLFFSDPSNNRVLVFDALPATLTTLEASSSYGENAESVFGQPDFTSNGQATTQSGLNYPEGISYDTSFKRLFVADAFNNRVMEFSFVMVIDPELPGGTVGVPYNYTIDTTSYQGTVSFSLLSGSIPEGLSFNSSTGVISGTPTEAGDNTFSIEIIDNLAAEGTFSDLMIYTLTISPETANTVTTSSESVRSSSGGHQIIVLCNAGDKFSTTTGLPCTTFQTPSQVLPATSCLITSILKLGNKGAQVKCLQKGLSISADGIFGPKTKNAVKLFQKANNLKPDGIVGPLTKKLLTI